METRRRGGRGWGGGKGCGRGGGREGERKPMLLYRKRDELQNANDEEGLKQGKKLTGFIQRNRERKKDIRITSTTLPQPQLALLELSSISLTLQQMTKAPEPIQQLNCI